jgi:hypothetical protein
VETPLPSNSPHDPMLLRGDQLHQHLHCPLNAVVLDRHPSVRGRNTSTLSPHPSHSLSSLAPSSNSRRLARARARPASPRHPRLSALTTSAPAAPAYCRPRKSPAAGSRCVDATSMCCFCVCIPPLTHGVIYHTRERSSQAGRVQIQMENSMYPI